MGVLNNNDFQRQICPGLNYPSRLRVGSKKHALSLPEGSVQSCPEASRRKGRSRFSARSVCLVRERGKMARTPPAAFFNRPKFTQGFMSDFGTENKRG